MKFLKYNVVSRNFILDNLYRKKDDFYSVSRSLIEDESAELFVNYLNNKFTAKGVILDMNLVKFEFKSFFHICSKCGSATAKKEYKKKYKTLCKKCYDEARAANEEKTVKARYEKKRISKLKEYLKTDQGKIDLIDLSIIKNNIYVEMKKQGKTKSELATLLDISPASVTALFSTSKSIKLDRLYLISEWLFVPIELLIRKPIGYSYGALKNGIPEKAFSLRIKKGLS